jgi:hypothetical protein
MKFKFVNLLAVSAFLFFGNLAHAQSHGHLNIGAVGVNQNDSLTFDNGADFAANSDYVKTLTFTNAGKYAGFYAGNITLTVLAATSGFGGPVENAPALGSHIKAQIVSVDGPAGGAFGFWDTTSTTAPTFSIPSGATNTNSFDVSQTDGSPGVDPFGHIHGRQFTATKPGIYAVTFKAFDVCTNGAGGGPIHSDSVILKIYFQAGINIASLTETENGTGIRFGTLLNRTFFLESNHDLSTTNWNVIGSVSGVDHFQTLNDANHSAAKFYRVRVTDP